MLLIFSDSSGELSLSFSVLQNYSKMAAYGALVSLMNIIDQLQTHPHPPISIDQQQLESLTHAITSLQQFLQGYAPHRGYTEEVVWESRIAEAAYHAEDVMIKSLFDLEMMCKTSPPSNFIKVLLQFMYLTCLLHTRSDHLFFNRSGEGDRKHEFDQH